MAPGEDVKASGKMRREDREFQASRRLSRPAEGEEVAITGMAGKFPDSDDIYHFRDNLFNKVDLVSADFRRWKPIHPEVPQRTGKLNDIFSFDAGFFGVHHRHANNMDPLLRMMLERSFEAIVDAGYHPSELVGTKTGVFVGTCFSETEKSNFYLNQVKGGHAVLGSTRSMIPHSISYFFGLQGPSLITDTACSSSMYALEHAYKCIRRGYCDMALVAGGGLCLHPIVSLQFARLGVLSMEGICKVFDNDADGYARSETVSVIFLQKSKIARRLYARIIHSKLNSDGYKQQGITFPSSEMQRVLMKEVYSESEIEAEDVTYVEAHGTGTSVGDPEELNSLVDVFLPKRKKTLYIGAVKSNTGHNEPSAGITSVVKVLIALESGFIPPNRNYSKPRESVEALVSGRMRVVTEKMPLPDNNGIVGVNCFGFGGSNGHVILQWNKKAKINGGLPDDDLPRLVCVSGRTEEALNAIWKDLAGRNLDAEFVQLLHTVFSKKIFNHRFRGYQILSKKGGEVKRSIARVGDSERKLACVFSNFSTNWVGVGKQLMELPLFGQILNKIQGVVGKGINVDLVELLTSFNRENSLNQILATVAVQISLVEILKALKIDFDLVAGLGTGELIAAYYVNQLSLDEVVFASLFTGFAFCKKKAEKIHEDSFIYKELLNNLKNVVPAPYASYQKWLPNYIHAQTHQQGSAEYFAQSVTSPVDFGEVKKLLPNDAEVLVIGEKLKGGSSLVEEASDNPLLSFLNSLGFLYESGSEMSLDQLYPKTAWPVSRGTPMLSPLIKWKYDTNWFVGLYKNEHEITSGQRVVHVILKEIEWNFVTGHMIDGRNLFPATGYLTLVWETLAMMLGKLMSDMRIVFEDVKFLRAINLTKDDNVEMITSIHIGEKKFEIVEGDTVVVSGKIYELPDIKSEITRTDETYTKTNDKETLKQPDIYKELRIRGYGYKGAFKALQECDLDAKKGLVSWTGNWIPFMDTMLQMMILQMDTKNLYIPTSIKSVFIDAPRHIEIASKLGAEPKFPVYADKKLELVRSGAIEFRGMKANSIPRRKRGAPVLETYKFVPNEAKLSAAQSIRVFMQLILENNATIKVKSVEVPCERELLSPFIAQALGDLPLIQAETIIVTTDTGLDLPSNIKTDDKKINTQLNSLIAVVPNAFADNEIIDNALVALRETNGYIIAREVLNFDISAALKQRDDLEILAVHRIGEEYLVLLRRKFSNYKRAIVVDVNESVKSWLPVVQNAIKDGQKLILYSQNSPIAGILGLVNCLRREPNGSCVSCFFILDDAPKFDPDHSFYNGQVRKNFAINVWKAGKWGSYRHLSLEENALVDCEHCYANVTVRGDLSSMKYLQGYLHNNYQPPSDYKLAYVYYAALNFRDVMTASGRIVVETVTKDRAKQDCVQGIEFSGRDVEGRKIMGMVLSGSLATHVEVDSKMLWQVPNDWSLEEAATVPVAYATVIYALMMRMTIKNGQSILIHSATGGVGQAAIIIAHHFKCDIYVTVGNQEKREYLLKNYPYLKADHIGNSRDTSFELMVQRLTKGRGVDIVLNSLAEEKLVASVRCLAEKGNFLEIGKFDMDSDNRLKLELYKRGATFHGIMLDAVFLGKAYVKSDLNVLITDLMKKGAIKPLPRVVFKRDEVSDAFKYMAAGKHMGKVLVNIREEENEKVVLVKRETFKGVPRFYCDVQGTYIIVGGLGGFGLQLADWLIIRRARHVVLTSRNGVKTGFQAMLLRLWKSYGTEVIIRTDDVTTKEGCIELIKFANSLGPVKAVFNLAVVLRDALFENQTLENFEISLAPKAIATQHLDSVTRQMCPDLSQFVVFSSVSCGRGNAGQTNYAMANSVMERICEQRRADGYPALAIQWGAVGDVGLVAEMQDGDSDIAIGGTLQQKIASCLQVMDTFMRQNEVIVGSMVVAEKSASSGANNIIDAVLNILGIPDLKTISLHTSFPELGMDSMMGVEIKQTLEREYEVFLSAQDIRTMNFARLQDIAKGKAASQDEDNELKPEVEAISEDLKLLLHHIADDKLAYKPFIEFGEKVEENGLGKIYVFPGIEGTATAMVPLIKNLNANATCLQYSPDDTKSTIEEWAKSLLPYFDTTSKSFTLVAHSFGCVVITEIVRLLEEKGRVGKVVYIDGTPEMMTAMVKKQFDVNNLDIFETEVVCLYLSRYLPTNTILTHKPKMLECSTMEERVKYGLSISPSLDMSSEFLTSVSIQGYRRMKAVANYVPNFPKLKSKAILLKPEKDTIVGMVADCGLANLFENPVGIATFKGNHLTILDNPEVAQSIRKFILDEPDENVTLALVDVV